MPRSNCNECDSRRVVSLSAECPDGCRVLINGIKFVGDLPDDLGIGENNEISLAFCLDCGIIQGDFPLDESTIESSDKDLDLEH